MDIIIDSVEVVTVYPKPNPGAINLATDELFSWRRIWVNGHLTANFFPFQIIWSLPVVPTPPNEYPKAHPIGGGSTLTSPISAKFTSIIDIYDGLTYEVGRQPIGFKTFMLIPIEGLYRIRLQASWLPLFVVAASESIEIEVNSIGQEDCVVESYRDASRKYAIR